MSSSICFSRFASWLHETMSPLSDCSKYFQCADNVADRALESTRWLQHRTICLNIQKFIVSSTYSNSSNTFRISVSSFTSYPLVVVAALAKFLLVRFVSLCACLFGCWSGRLYKLPQALPVWTVTKVKETAVWARATQRTRVRWSPAKEQATFAASAFDRPKLVTC